MLTALNRVLFHFGNDAVTSAEILGFVTGILNVFYIVKEKTINFPIGIANAAFFLVLFLHVHFFADGYLQVLYIILGFQGWWAWLNAGPNRTALKVYNAKLWEVTGALCVTTIVTFILWPLLVNAHDLAPWWDALTTGLSVGATLLMNFKRIESWYLWMFLTGGPMRIKPFNHPSPICVHGRMTVRGSWSADAPTCRWNS